jgi:hypothetical protein
MTAMWQYGTQCLGTATAALCPPHCHRLNLVTPLLTSGSPP